MKYAWVLWHYISRLEISLAQLLSNDSYNEVGNIDILILERVCEKPYYVKVSI